MSINRYANVTHWLASLAYASGFKRAARSYVLGSVCALWTVDAELVMNGPLLSTVRRVTPPR